MTELWLAVDCCKYSWCCREVSVQGMGNVLEAMQEVRSLYTLTVSVSVGA